MDISLNTNAMDMLFLFLFIFLPLILFLIGAAVGFMNILFYFLCISWFGIGMIFYKAIHN